MWFLNGRPLRDKVLSRCLKDAHRGFLVEGRQPVAFLSLALDPSKVDVNVHPAKAEVRFRDEKRMFGFLVAKLRDAVRSTDMSTPGERLIAFAERRDVLVPRPGPTQYTLPDAGGSHTSSRFRPSCARAWCNTITASTITLATITRRTRQRGRAATRSAGRSCKSRRPTSCARCPTASRSSTNTRCTSD